MCASPVLRSVLRDVSKVMNDRQRARRTATAAWPDIDRSYVVVVVVGAAGGGGGGSGGGGSGCLFLMFTVNTY